MITSIKSLQQQYTIKTANKIVKQIQKYTATNDKNLIPKMEPEVQLMIKLWTPDVAIERIQTAAKLDVFRPRDLSFEMFAISADLPYVRGDFSTFNPELSKMWKENIDDDEIRFVIREEIQNNLRPVAQQYANQLAHLIKKHSKICRAAQKNTYEKNPNILEMFLQTLANELKAEFGLYSHNLKVVVIDSWKKIPRRLHVYGLTDAYAMIDIDVNKSTIYINRKSILEEKSKKYKFNAIIASLSHEFGHFIDWHNPDASALGAQKAMLDSIIYDEAQYEDNATEESSAMIEKFVYKKLNEMQRM